MSLVCDSVAPSWTSDAFSGSLHWPKRSLAAGPPRLATKVHPHMNPAPPRVPHCLLSRPTCRSDQLPGFCAPSTTPLGQAPMERIVHARSWFRSQAFPTSQRFPSKSEFRGLVSCRSRSGFSLQRFPLAGIARPFQGRFCSLAVIHRRAEWPPPQSYHRRFPRRPRA